MNMPIAACDLYGMKIVALDKGNCYFIIKILTVSLDSICIKKMKQL